MGYYTPIDPPLVTSWPTNGRIRVTHVSEYKGLLSWIGWGFIMWGLPRKKYYFDKDKDDIRGHYRSLACSATKSGPFITFDEVMESTAYHIGYTELRYKLIGRVDVSCN